MPYKIGDTVIFCLDMDSIDSLGEYKITKVSSDTITCGGENVFYRAFCWPVKYKAEIENILQIRSELKKRYEDSISLVYELRNRVIREEQKERLSE